jgi:hypothetical protein
MCVRVAIGSMKQTHTEKKKSRLQVAYLPNWKQGRVYYNTVCVFYVFHIQLTNQVTTFHDAWCKRYEIGEHNAVSLFNFLQS